jgi:hypothetical protein
LATTLAEIQNKLDAIDSKLLPLAPLETGRSGSAECSAEVADAEDGGRSPRRVARRRRA